MKRSYYEHVRLSLIENRDYVGVSELDNEWRNRVRAVVCYVKMKDGSGRTMPLELDDEENLILPPDVESVAEGAMF